jgi:fumarate hydratase class II
MAGKRASVPGTRVVHDSFGELHVPVGALYGASTQRAVENFPISGLPMPPPFLRALGLVKAAAAEANGELGLLPKAMAKAIAAAAKDVAAGDHDEHFPIDVFQTGSGTSSNMNANEVIATLASRALGKDVHPNDHVNLGQSSNDVVPTAIQVAAALCWHEQLRPALAHLKSVVDRRARELSKVVKTGRTHLMDAMPLTLGQELSAWSRRPQPRSMPVWGCCRRRVRRRSARPRWKWPPARTMRTSRSTSTRPGRAPRAT